MAKERKINKKLISGTIAAVLVLFSFVLAYAEDYPAGYMGAGYREYLGGKIQNGYFVEEFNRIDVLQNARVDKRNDIENMVERAYEATPEANHGIFAAEFQQKDNSDKLKTEIIQQSKQREKVASTETEFYYVKYSDGKVEYFKDGLLNRVENERVADEFGNASVKNTYDMKYNDKRLLVSYNANLTDKLGNVTKIRWWGATYTADSVYYANKDTTANRNLTEYYMEETDSAGNVKLTHWEALSYEGKFLRAFSQSIDETVWETRWDEVDRKNIRSSAIAHFEFTRSDITYIDGDIERVQSYHEEGIGTDGLSYVTDRTDIAYNARNQIGEYHEETTITQVDGTKTKIITDAEFEYTSAPAQFGSDVDPDPERLLGSILTTTTENADGSTRTETNTTTYEYDANNQLIGGQSHAEFSGQESDWYQYTDAQGHTLTKTKNQNNEDEYYYINPDTLAPVVVPAAEVTSTLKEGYKYRGYSDTEYEVVEGHLMAKETRSRIYHYGKNINDEELQNVEDTTITYTNGLVTYIDENGTEYSRVQLLSTHEYTEINDPLRDPEGTHLTTRDINTAYSYDNKGNIFDVEASGNGQGWEYSAERSWWGEYNSTLLKYYDVILGKPVETDTWEHKNYAH